MEEDCIEVWPVELRAGEAACGVLRELLSKQEQARAESFARPELARKYVLRRGVLRLLLGRYLRREGRELEIVSGQWGKPEVAGAEGLQFNLAHSGDLAVMAFAWNCAVGVDVELRRAVPDLELIAQRYFSVAEVDELLAKPAGEGRDLLFLQYWTRKEAVLKADGRGLSMPIPDAREEQVAGWRVRKLELSAEYVAALAYAGAERTICAEGLLPVESFLPR